MDIYLLVMTIFLAFVGVMILIKYISLLNTLSDIKKEVEYGIKAASQQNDSFSVTDKFTWAMTSLGRIKEIISK